MGSLLRLAVCGGLFVAGYYLGRQSYRLELQRELQDAFDGPDGPETDIPKPEERDAGG
jgi:hypothetical protein